MQRKPSSSMPNCDTLRMYYVVISENGPSTSRALFERMHPVEVFWGGYFVLNFMCQCRHKTFSRVPALTRCRYLKFTVIWRFFRVWALADGVCACSHFVDARAAEVV